MSASLKTCPKNSATLTFLETGVWGGKPEGRSGPATYDSLRETLVDKTHFCYSNEHFKYRHTIFVAFDIEQISKFIVYDVEYNIVEAIYIKVRNTTNTRLLKRVSKLDDLAKYHYS